MRKRFLTMLALFAMTTGAWADGERTSHWPDFNPYNYEGNEVLVAGITIDGVIITASCEDWNQLEVAAFVGNECRSAYYEDGDITSKNFLYNGYVEEYGDPFPILDGMHIYYNDSGETLTFKMYNHATGVEYTACAVTYQGDPITIETGEEHTEGWDDPENPIFLNFTTPEPAGPEVTWDKTTKTGTFTMPVYDVELQVEYYPAMLSLGGDAIEGGTLEVVGLTGDALPAGFEKDAEGNIYVAEGTTFTVKATPAEGYHFVCWSDDETNTNPEREITMPAQDLAFSATAIFAENEYDITFSEGTNPDPENPEWTATPNPAKTKQTVTVTYTGTKKVIGVKAEKKAAAPTLKDALADGATVVINYTWFDENVTTFTYTNNGGTYTGSATGTDAGYFANGMSMSGTTLRFTASNTDATEANVSIDFYTDTNEYYFNSKDTGFTSFTISVNGTDLTSQLKEVK